MVNKVILIGNIGRDPEWVSDTTTRASIATTESYVNKDGKKIDETYWHNLVIFGKSAGTFLTYVQKGSRLYIEGKLTYNQYEKNGVTITSSSIVVTSFRFLGGDSNEKKEEVQKAKPETSESKTDFINSGEDDLPF